MSYESHIQYILLIFLRPHCDFTIDNGHEVNHSEMALFQAGEVL